jgi:hypothetical protein
VLATCGVLAVRSQFGPPEQLAAVEGPHGEWYALYAEYPVGDYDPSWHVYRFANREAFSSARVRRGFNEGALFETYEEAGDHDEDANLEILKGRFLVFSKAGLFHSLYDIECDRLLINEEDPFHERRRPPATSRTSAALSGLASTCNGSSSTFTAQLNTPSRLRRTAPANKPLKLSAAGFSRAAAVLDTQRGSITRGRSLAAIR